MKECPNCKSIFANDLFFCLHDGAPLTLLKESDSPKETSLPTEVWPKPTQPAPRPVWPYVVISILVLVSIGLASAMLVINRDRLIGSLGAGSDPDVKLKPNPSPQVEASPTVSPSQPSPSPASRATAQAEPVPKITPVPNANPTGRWKGEWKTKSGTLLDIELNLADTRNNGVDGHIKWTLRQSVRPDKMDKIGLSAIEYVRGSYDPVMGSIKMSGYKKDDPNNVLVMLDEYDLKISSGGKKLTGVARNGGRWNGYLDLSR